MALISLVTKVQQTIDVAIQKIQISISYLIKISKNININDSTCTIFFLFHVIVNGNLDSLMFFCCLPPSKIRFHNRIMQLLAVLKKICICSLTWQLRVYSTQISYSVSAKSTMMMNHTNWYKISDKQPFTISKVHAYWIYQPVFPLHTSLIVVRTMEDYTDCLNF